MDEDEATQLKASRQKEINHTFTLIYLLVENGRVQIEREEGTALRDGIGKVGLVPQTVFSLTGLVAALEPNFLSLLVRLIAKLRWDDTTNLPLPRVCNDFAGIHEFSSKTTDYRLGPPPLLEVSITPVRRDDGVE